MKQRTPLFGAVKRSSEHPLGAVTMPKQTVVGGTRLYRGGGRGGDSSGGEMDAVVMTIDGGVVFGDGSCEGGAAAVKMVVEMV
ncbi:hypothetical protein Tco_1283561 [Tanacetum coccineum]